MIRSLFFAIVNGPWRSLPRTWLTLLVCSTFALVDGCSHAPTKQPASSTPVTAANLTPTPEIATPPSLAVPEQNEATADAPVTLAESIVERDLLERIRAGFALEDRAHIAIDREVSWYARHPDYLDRTFRRAERYLYYIVDELSARNMPLELALLPVVESAFNPVALSRARAAGLWQFIPSTGKRYGLEQNRYYDGRRDVTESTRAALDYLQFLADEFNGDWLLAIAGYNCGEMNVARAIEKNRARNKPTDFFSLDLPKETRAYVPKLLAMRRIVATPADHGLEFGQISNEPYFAKVDIDGQLDLGVAAELAGMQKEELIALNPAFSRAVTISTGPQYLLLPVDRVEKFRDGLALLSPQQRVPMVRYTVRRGDTLGTIARHLGVTPAELRAANNLKSNVVHSGQELTLSNAIIHSASLEALPTRRSAARDNQGSMHKVQSGETLWSIARTHGVAMDTLAQRNSLDPNGPLTIGTKLDIPRSSATLASTNARSSTVQKITYVVRVGDTLSNIARQFRVAIADLVQWNKLSKASAIKSGQRLVMYVDDRRRSGG